jgi:hypothetical protein
MSQLSSSLIACVILFATIDIAHARSCAAEIERLQSEAANSSARTISGPTAPQSVAAQLGHQPTPASVERAQRDAQSRFADMLARAQILHSQGKRAACMKAVANARQMLELK